MYCTCRILIILVTIALNVAKMYMYLKRKRDNVTACMKCYGTSIQKTVNWFKEKESKML